jgi:phospholipid/cholesterol/gamma-HCH transport system substrate-binding protein
METRAPYALIGLFVLAVVGAAFGFVYWLNNTGGLGEKAVYRVRFQHTVSGLLTGAAVLFNGIRVGEVTDLGLNPDNPREVMATITVAATTPIRADAQAGLEFQGLTGVPVISSKEATRRPPRWLPPRTARRCSPPIRTLGKA